MWIEFPTAERIFIALGDATHVHANPAPIRPSAAPIETGATGVSAQNWRTASRSDSDGGWQSEIPKQKAFTVERGTNDSGSAGLVCRIASSIAAGYAECPSTLSAAVCCPAADHKLQNALPQHR
jgi:hypothetical protein